MLLNFIDELKAIIYPAIEARRTALSSRTAELIAGIMLSTTVSSTNGADIFTVILFPIPPARFSCCA